MMAVFKKIFLILVLVHIIGDFYLQSDNLAKRKIESFKDVLIHSLIYSLICSGLIIIISDEWIKNVAFTISFLHFIIDSIKYCYIKKNDNDFSKEKDAVIFAVDQIIHILTLVIISLIITENYSSINKVAIIEKIFSLAEIPSHQVFSWALVILFVGKPANITIKKLLSSYRPAISSVVINEELPDAMKSIEVAHDAKMQTAITNDNSKLITADEKRAGAFIGFLERVIIVIFLAINQYSAIGLVLTAKSIARYDKIAHDQVFAEYYLLGTLMSTVIVIITYFLVM